VDETNSISSSCSAGRTLGWANYLAMSWTWCIGMYLPVLIMRELGIWGVVTFAIPNMVGAAAIGWFVRDSQQSGRIVGQNRAACTWYSLITIVFHGYFAAWLIRQIAGPNAGAALAGGLLLLWAILQWRRGGEFLAAGLTLALSAAAMAWGFYRGELPYLAQPLPGAGLPMVNNVWLAPAWTLGFLCCPWLDLTFHNARQMMQPAQARAAFSLGFCAIFPLMLLITIAYSGWLVAAFDRSRYPQLAIILGAHLIGQSCLTVSLHAQQVLKIEPKIRLRRFLAFSALLIFAVGLGILIQDRGTFNGIAMGELIYRTFLGFYGFVFPAYVWLRMLRPRRSMLRVIVVIVIAAPLYWLAFGQEQMIFAAVGAAVIVLAKFLPETQATAGWTSGSGDGLAV
jgi:hypothetical protein